MFSKSLAMTLAVSLAVVLSCTPKVGEAPPPEKQPKLASLECLPEIGPVMKAFAKGEATQEQLVNMWDCSEKGVQSFKRYVYGRSEDRFEADELATFLETEFKSPKVSQGLRQQTMYFKRLVIGGSDQYVTRAELDTLATALGTFKALSLRINPYVKVLTQEWDPTKSFQKTPEQIEYFEKANAVFKSVSQDIAEMIVKTNQSYDLDQFPVFVKELCLFLQQGDETAKLVQKFLPAVKKVKAAVASGAEGQVSGSEWRNFLFMAANGYTQYLRYYYFVETAPKKASLENGNADLADYLARSISEFMQSFQILISQKPATGKCPESCISKQELSEALLALSQAQDGFKFSDKLLQEAMQLKILYFGGTTDSFTAKDFKKGHEKFGEVRTSMETLLPYYLAYKMAWIPSKQNPRGAQKWLDNATETLTAEAGHLSGLLDGAYNLQNLKELLQEIDRLQGPHDPASSFVRWMPLIIEAKGSVFSDSNPVVQPEQWTPFLKLMAQGYGAFMQYHYFVEGETYGRKSFLEGFKGLSDQAAFLASKVLSVNKNHVLTLSKVRSLVSRLADMKVFPEGLSSDSLNKLVEVFLERALWPVEDRLQGVASPGLAAKSVQNYQNEFQIWYETERYFYELAPARLSHSQLQNEIQKRLKLPISSSLRIGLEESALVLSGDVSKVVDRQGRLIISRRVRSTYGTHSLSQLNLHRAIGRELIRAAIDSRSRLDANQGIMLIEAQNLFARIRPALEDLALVDKKSKTFIESRFRESNVFSPHSNGDTLTNFQELTDIVGMIFSGAKINSAFRKDVVARCGVKPRPGQDTLISEACVYEVYSKNTVEHMASMPEYVRIFKNLNYEEWKVFFGFMLKSTGQETTPDATVKMSVLNLVPHVFQYMEMLFAKYDEDQNDIIDVNEALKAYPAFSGLLAELTKDQPLIQPEDLPALFTYILHYGAPPGGKKDFLFRWLPWKFNRKSWVVAADRMKLAQIFNFIAEKTRALGKPGLKIEDEDEIRQDPRFHQQVPEDDRYFGR
jgi:hypothetical protein